MSSGRAHNCLRCGNLHQQSTSSRAASHPRWAMRFNNIDRARDPANDLNDDLIEGTELCTFYLGFNASQPPFDDPKVRQALALALEIDKELEVTRKGLAARAAGFVPPGMFAYNETLEPSTFDLEAARQLLGESRYGGAENLPPIESFADDDAIHWA